MLNRAWGLRHEEPAPGFLNSGSHPAAAEEAEIKDLAQGLLKLKHGSAEIINDDLDRNHPTELFLRAWFLGFYSIRHAKNGISALALTRHLGVSYRTAWLIHHMNMKAMEHFEGLYVLSGKAQIDDAYFGGELNGGKPGRGSENKVPFVAALEMSADNRPIHLKLNLVSGFTNDDIEACSVDSLAPGSVVFSDGLSCFPAVAAAGCDHVPVVIGGRKPQDVPLFQWLN